MSETTASESGDWPTEAMIKAGADTLVSDLDEYKDDIAGFARQIAIDVYAVMIGNKSDGQPSTPSGSDRFHPGNSGVRHIGAGSRRP